MKIVLGCMEVGKKLSEKDSSKLIKEFLEDGFKEIDTAYMYAFGQSESILGLNKQLIKDHKGLIATKINPNDDAFQPKIFREKLDTSLTRLSVESVDLLYLHWPCHNLPIKPLLKEVNKLHEEGKFKRFGLSNYASWEVAKIVEYCEKKGLIKPSVYQGMYNCLTRDVERELFPCLRDYKFSFYAYNPLAGGLLTGRHKMEDAFKNSQLTSCRFYGEGTHSETVYRERYWKNEQFKAIKTISEKLPPSLDLLQASFNWLIHHSCLKENNGDAIILGASTIEQFNQNINKLKNSMPLESSLLEEINQAYRGLAGVVPSYFR